MTSLYSPAEYPAGHSDSFQTSEFIDFTRSSHVVYEEFRTLVHPERVSGGDMLQEPFDDIASWDLIRTGSASVGVISTNESDPAVGDWALDLQTGRTIGSAAGVQKYVHSIPSSYGVLLIPYLVDVGTDMMDALNLWITNSDNRRLMLRFNYGILRVRINDVWTVLSGHLSPPNVYGPEWWIEVKKLDRDNYRVSAYAGTELKGTATGTLMDVPGGDDGLVHISQQSVRTANRHSRISILNIGATQMPSDMTLVSMPQYSPVVPVQGCIAIAAEDVSVTLAANENLIAYMSNDDGRTWNQVLLQDFGGIGLGELGTRKLIHFLSGCVGMTTDGNNIRYRLDTIGGFFVLQNVTYYWE